jgi:transposase
MDAPQPLSPDVLAALPPTVAAFLQWQTEQLRVLTARVAELEARLGKDSTNSSLPPSATHPHAKPPRPKSQARRPPGGQPGHAKHERALIPTEQCQEVVPCVPTQCRRRGRPLTGADPEPIRHQVWELPDIQPIVREYQQHRLVCSCGCSTRGPLPSGIPAGQAGPRLIAFNTTAQRIA